MQFAYRWGLIGAAFGTLFPAAAIAIRCAQANGAVATVLADPLMWMIFTAPAFLGLFASVGGGQLDKLQALRSRLEVIVEERTQELASIADRLSLVLGSVADAMVTIRDDGLIDGAPRAQSFAWFGREWEKKSLWEYLAPGDAALASRLAAGLEQLREGVLPLELCLQQLPQRLEVSDRHFTLEYLPMATGQGPQLMLVVVRDETAAVARATAEADRVEQLGLISRYLQDSLGFRMFRDECASLIAEARATTSETALRRAVHTLKGNAGAFGCLRVAVACQRIEDAWSESGEVNFGASGVSELSAIFDRCMSAISPFVSGDDGDMARIDRSELLALISAVRAQTPADEVARTLKKWSFSPLAPTLERLGAHASEIAKRLEKPVVVSVDGAGVRLDLTRYGQFLLTLVHVVRNAIDHGLEPADDRVAAGKEPVSSLTLKAQQSADGVVIEIRDDGRGIDWDAVAAKAREAGLPFDSPAHRTDALFADGLSTASTLGELSGQGVGLSAVRAVALKLGVAIEIDTAAGRGTSFRFHLPEPTQSVVPPA